MAMAMAAIGFAASLAQLGGANPVQLMGMIWDSAQNAKVHKSNCRKFAGNLQRIGSLLYPLMESKHLQAEALQEPLTKLKELLFFGFILVDNCKNKNKFWVFAFSWYKQIPKKFQDMEREIRSLILTCVPLINTHLQINHQNDMVQMLKLLREEVKKMQGTYGQMEIESSLTKIESVRFGREHEKLQEGYKREQGRVEKLLQQRRNSRRAGQPANPSEKAERADLPPDQNPLTENWHLYALKYSNEYRYWHSKQLCQSNPGHLSHSNSLPPRAAPRQYVHSLSVNDTAHRTSPPEVSAESIIIDVYCAIGYSYSQD